MLKSIGPWLVRMVKQLLLLMSSISKCEKHWRIWFSDALLHGKILAVIFLIKDCSTCWLKQFFDILHSIIVLVSVQHYEAKNTVYRKMLLYSATIKASELKRLGLYALFHKYELISCTSSSWDSTYHSCWWFNCRCWCSYAFGICVWCGSRFSVSW